MGVPTGGGRGKSRLLVIALIVLGVIAFAGVAAGPAAAAMHPTTYQHGGATCTTCHGADLSQTPTTSTCTTCHGNFVLRNATAYSCWSCHAPGQSMATAQTNAGCTGTCHVLAGTSGIDYTSTVSHGTTPHLGANAVGCRTCHTVSTGALDATGSPHHVTTTFTAPTQCTDCHGNFSVPAAPAPHAAFVASVTSCADCHEGYSPTHTNAGQAVAPTLTLTATQPVGNPDVALAGSLKNGTTALANVAVYLQTQASGGSTWTDLPPAPVTTTSTGAFTYTVAAAAPGSTYRAVSQGAVSGQTVVKPAVKTATVTVPVVKETITLKLTGLTLGKIKLGKSVTAKGAIKPTLTVAQGVTLTVQKKRANGKYATVKTLTTLKTMSAYSKPYKPASRGTYRMRASLAKTAAHTAATSPWRSFTVK